MPRVKIVYVVGSDCYECGITPTIIHGTNWETVTDEELHALKWHMHLTSNPFTGIDARPLLIIESPFPFPEQLRELVEMAKVEKDKKDREAKAREAAKKAKQKLKQQKDLENKRLKLEQLKKELGES